MYQAAVLTVSDRSFRGERSDTAGPLVAKLLCNAGYAVIQTAVVPDEQAQIEKALRTIADAGTVQLLITTGGTGFAPRDVTPEATVAVCDRLVPGIPEAMRLASLQITPRAMLSRSQAGIRGGTLIINLPGSPKAARENLEALPGPRFRDALRQTGGLRPRIRPAISGPSVTQSLHGHRPWRLSYYAAGVVFQRLSNQFPPLGSVEVDGGVSGSAGSWGVPGSGVVVPGSVTSPGSTGSTGGW